MIFGLQYALVVAGYAASAFLLGNYMILYAGATQLELGLMFTIQPAVILVRPFVCSLADRYQAHRTIYLYCSLLSFLFHVPFILLPFVAAASWPASHANATLDDDDQLLGPPRVVISLEQQANQSSPAQLVGQSAAPRSELMAELALVFTERVRFWVLVVSHFAGCVFFCCMRTLGDVLTVNHCRRMRTNYTKYRKLSPISFGMCSLVLGYINCNQQLLGLPDYVPGFILYSACHMTLFVLFYLWPEEYFEMVSEAQVEGLEGPPLRPLPMSWAEIGRHMRRKLRNLFVCCRPASDPLDDRQLAPATTTNRLGTMQQVRIIGVLLQEDFRIPLYMLVLVGCGVMGHSVQNFVYVYLAEVCREQNCSSSTISGYIMLGICVTETFAYSLSSRYFQFQSKGQTNKLIKVELALAVLALHYLALAFLVHQSAYYFLAEALHGFEFGLMIATGIELGDYFANEVALIIPQLRAKNIIGKGDDLNLVRVSLVATMLGCFLLVYDGLGGFIGCLLFGFIVDEFGFLAAFKLNALLSFLFLAALLLCSFATRHAPLKPRILRPAQQVAITKEASGG